MPGGVQGGVQVTGCRWVDIFGRSLFDVLLLLPHDCRNCSSVSACVCVCRVCVRYLFVHASVSVCVCVSCVSVCVCVRYLFVHAAV